MRCAAPATRLYLSLDDGTGDVEPWRSDGTSAGTIRIKDVNPTGPSNASDFAVLGDQAFFAADDGVNGDELWRTDGTAAGTVRAGDIRAGPVGSAINRAHAVGARVVFEADDGVAGEELWAADGGIPADVLLRSTAVSSIAPVTPPLASVLPLDVACDRYRTTFLAGGHDPECGLLRDTRRPLVFYTLGASTLKLTKTPSGAIRVGF